MSAIVINTRYDYRNATGNDQYYGTPADIDYLSKYPDAAQIVKDDRIMMGQAQSGYAHYLSYGKALGYKYNLALNDVNLNQGITGDTLTTEPAGPVMTAGFDYKKIAKWGLILAAIYYLFIYKKG